MKVVKDGIEVSCTMYIIWRHGVKQLRNDGGSSSSDYNVISSNLLDTKIYWTLNKIEGDFNSEHKNITQGNTL